MFETYYCLVDPGKDIKQRLGSLVGSIGQSYRTNERQTNSQKLGNYCNKYARFESTASKTIDEISRRAVV